MEEIKGEPCHSISDRNFFINNFAATLSTITIDIVFFIFLQQLCQSLGCLKTLTTAVKCSL